MKRLSRKEIAEGLRGQTPGGDMAPADVFWADFRARARLRVQEEAAAPAGRAWHPVSGWAMATACAMLLLVWGSVYSFRGRAASDLTKIRSVSVSASHSAVLIIDDAPTHGTILWVVDMAEAAEGGNT